MIAGIDEATGTPLLRVHRVYTGADGETHVDELTFPMPRLRGVRHQTDWLPAGPIAFRQVAGDSDSGWHPAPSRQIVIPLQGVRELVTSDGTSVPVSPGTVFLVEDVEGVGHLTRGDGGERLYLFVQIPDDWHPSTSTEGATP